MFQHRETRPRRAVPDAPPLSSELALTPTCYPQLNTRKNKANPVVQAVCEILLNCYANDIKRVKRDCEFGLPQGAVDMAAPGRL
jgi:hypothetical protein